MEPRGIPGDREFTTSLSQAIGFLAVQFGLFEFSLTATIAVIHQGIGQPIAGGGELPYELKRKMRYVREAASRYSALCSYKAEMLDLMILAKRLAKTRHGVMHGYPADYDPETQMLTFRSARPDSPDKSIHRESLFIISIGDLLDDGTRAEGLASRMGRLAHRLLDELVPQDERDRASSHSEAC